MKTITFSIILTFLLLSSCTSDDTEVLKARADKALISKNYDQAIGILNNALKINPDDAELNYYMGQVYKQKIFMDGKNINSIDPNLVIEASSYFNNTIAITPNYNGKIFVTGPYSKIQTLWGSLGLTLISKNQVEEARKAFIKGQKEGGFYPAIMEYNKNIMASCDSNAILFTNGDNDTFPMWFLQLVDDYRKDITVVNLSLLNLPWYVKQLKNNYSFGNNSISIDMKDQEIDLLRPTKWEEQQVQILDKNNNSIIEWSLLPTIEGRGLRGQDLMVLKILKSNKFKRPIYFSTTVSTPNKIGLDKYLSLEGLVYRLELQKKEISHTKIEDNCMSIYTYEGLKDIHLEYVVEANALYLNYKFIYFKMAEAYFNNGEINRAKDIFTQIERKFPESKIPYSDDELKDQLENFKNKL
jgi:tetratricopeptide (TPR) repeat protein